MSRTPQAESAAPPRPRSSCRSTSTGARRAPRPASASSTTCSTCSPATAGSACEVEAERRPRDRRPPHGRGRRHRARAGARRGARRPRRDPPLRLRRGADGRVAGRVRDRHLRPAATALFDADLPTTSIAGFDTELAEEFFRAVANSAKLTLHVYGPLRHQRPPHDRGLLQGLRPRAARRRLDRPRGERRALDQGDARASEHPDRDPRLRDGQPALGREGARARRRDRDDHQRPRRGRAPPTG